MAEVTLTFYNSQRGAKKLALGGYSYWFDKDSKGRFYCRCDLRKCTGRAVTEGNMVVSTKEHNQHEPDREKLHVSNC